MSFLRTDEDARGKHLLVVQFVYSRVINTWRGLSPVVGLHDHFTKGRTS